MKHVVELVVLYLYMTFSTPSFSPDPFVHTVQHYTQQVFGIWLWIFESLSDNLPAQFPHLHDILLSVLFVTVIELID